MEIVTEYSVKIELTETEIEELKKEYDILVEAIEYKDSKLIRQILIPLMPYFREDNDIGMYLE